MSDVILWLAGLLVLSVALNVGLLSRELGRIRSAYWRSGR